MSTKDRSAIKELWYEWGQPLLIAAAIVLPIKSSLADYNFVPTGSMKPTIMEGELVLVNKLAYDLKIPFTTAHIVTWADPARGDIVVLFSPEDGIRLVKRVVAVPGDTVELRNNVLWINGAPAHYKPLPSSEYTAMSPVEKKAAAFASETVGNRSHAVMALPFCPSERRSFPPERLQPGKYFVMGDNRDNSKDSRYFGVIDRSLIVGNACAILASVDKNEWFMPRLGRFFCALH